VAGLLEDRLDKGKQDLEDSREAVKALCEPVLPPLDSAAYLRYFCAIESGNVAQLKENEPKRLKLYKFVASLIRAYATIASELEEAGYSAAQVVKIKAEVDHASKVRDEVRLASGDYIDLKAYEPAMRHLIDTYIRAEESEKISAFDDMSLIQLIVERGVDETAAKVKGMMKTDEAVAEAIENNVRKLIINESPLDPAYYDRMSQLLDTLIEQRRTGVLKYKEYLEKIANLAKDVTYPGGRPEIYPATLKTSAQRALFNNLKNDEALALAVDAAVLGSLQHGWKAGGIKAKRVQIAIFDVMEKAHQASLAAGFTGVRQTHPKYDLEAEAKRILDLAMHQNDYPE
jgi:type I restriction enzyme R subunit